MEILKLKTEKYEKNKIHWIGFKSKLGTAKKKDQWTLRQAVKIIQTKAQREEMLNKINRLNDSIKGV